MSARQFVISIATLFVIAALPLAAQQPPVGPAQAPTPAPTSVGTGVDTFNMKMYGRLRRALVGAVDKMPEDGFSLRPSEGARTFAETANHISSSNLSMCQVVNGKPFDRPALQARVDAATSKAAVLALMKESVEECDPIFASPGTERAAMARQTFTVHSWEVYGTMAAYLRMKNIVPPTTEEDMAARKMGGAEF